MVGRKGAWPDLEEQPVINDRIEDILADHPHLLPDEVYAAVTFAADDMAQEEMILASGQRW